MTKGQNKDFQKIQIDIADWCDEFFRAEVDLSDPDKLAEIAAKYTAAQLSRMAVVAHQLGQAKKRYLPENKPLFATGAHLHTAQLLASREKSVQLANGSNITIREFVGPVRGEDDHVASDNHEANVTSPEPLDFDQPFVMGQSQQGLERALEYLHRRVPGYVMGRLKLIAANGGDVKAEAEVLKAKIDEMVEGLG